MKCSILPIPLTEMHTHTQCKQYEQLMKDDTKLLYSYVLYKQCRQLLLVPIWPTPPAQPKPSSRANTTCCSSSPPKLSLQSRTQSVCCCCCALQRESYMFNLYLGILGNKLKYPTMQFTVSALLWYVTIKGQAYQRYQFLSDKKIKAFSSHMRLTWTERPPC